MPSYRKILHHPASLWRAEDRAVRVEALRRGLAHRVSEIIAMRQPAWGMKVDRSVLPSPTQSKIGGCPAAPADFQWPRLGGCACRFVAQIDLGALPRHPIAELRGELPSEGHLLFFVNEDWVDEPVSSASDGMLVHYYGPETELRPAAPPADMKTLWPLKETPLAVTPIWTLPSTMDDWPHFEGWGSAEIDLLNTWRYDSDVGGPHRLLGWSDNIQTPLEHPNHSDLGEAWRLLFQLDSDSECQLDVFGGGCSYFAIERKALLKRQFTRIAFINQFT